MNKEELEEIINKSIRTVPCTNCDYSCEHEVLFQEDLIKELMLRMDRELEKYRNAVIDEVVKIIGDLEVYADKDLGYFYRDRDLTEALNKILALKTSNKVERKSDE